MSFPTGWKGADAPLTTEEVSLFLKMRLACMRLSTVGASAIGRRIEGPCLAWARYEGQFLISVPHSPLCLNLTESARRGKWVYNNKLPAMEWR